MKRRPLIVLALALSAVASANAGVIITLDTPHQSAGAGSTLEFFGTITNADLANSVFLNEDSLTVTAANGDFTVTDQFFSNIPVSLAAGGNSGDIELFDVTITSPFPDTFKTYTGTYQLLGGIDGDAQNVLGGTSFTVTALAPEPLTTFLLGSGLAAIGLLRRKQRAAIATRV